jgi:hypothetical protein
MVCDTREVRKVTMVNIVCQGILSALSSLNFSARPGHFLYGSSDLTVRV